MNNLLKKILGIMLVIISVLIILTPFTPGSILFFIGFGLLGIRLSMKHQKKDGNKK